MLRMDSFKRQYIPVGCVGFLKSDLEIEDDAWNSITDSSWISLRWPDDDAINDTESVGTSTSAASHPIQSALTQSKALRSYFALFMARWIDMEFCISPIDMQIVVFRILILPDDVERGLIDRSDVKLAIRRRDIARRIDFSSEAWDSTRLPAAFSGPIPFGYDGSDAGDDGSLLDLFNQIPSPEPNPNIIEDHHSQTVANEILNSKIPGLVSELHPYQKRSVALMLQKEAQPQQLPDPRLLRVKAHNGIIFHYDPVTGEIVLNQRMYDDVRGGILAEEMGSGKTIMCLALILATRDSPSITPEIYRTTAVPVRKKLGSLCDMAAACATRNSVPWRLFFTRHSEYEYRNYLEAFKRNPGYYYIPPPKARRSLRVSSSSEYTRPPKKMLLSSTNLVIVPNNLLAQWQEEIKKHTVGLDMLVLKKDDAVPLTDSLVDYDLILIGQAKFESLARDFDFSESPLASIQFKRCIVDEGHVLGNSSMNRKSNLLIGLDSMSFSSRWIVTGTPSKGLFGVDEAPPPPQSSATAINGGLENGHIEEQQQQEQQEQQNKKKQKLDSSQLKMEKKDLDRIGSITVLYLKARPWANMQYDSGDAAPWSTYLLLPRHRKRSYGRWDCLKSTLNSLIVRHRLHEIGDLLPPVEEKVVQLEGSYQDQLSVNIFSMMIIFNAVQSERTDMDYFFHAKQRKNLLLIVHNLKQTSFFGGSFFSRDEIKTSVETAEEFLEKKKVQVSLQDEMLLRQAIEFGHVVMANELRNQSNLFHELPVCVTGLPHGAGSAWSLDGGEEGAVCTSTSMLLALQKRIFKAAMHPEDFNSLLNGGLIQEGLEERQKHLDAAAAPKKGSKAKEKKQSETLAGNTKLGDDSPRKTGLRAAKDSNPPEVLTNDIDLGPLKAAMITSTVSAKLTYLIDSLLKHQDDEKIIIFYENDNFAWYLASMLDVLQIQYLIYAKGLTVERRAQYVSSFHHNPSFRVLLMDLSQAAFGLDMKVASRIYFINPVLNPQVQAQAIGRVRRISQQKPVSVETLVLMGSIDEVLLERQQHMTQAEHRRAKSILDIRPIYNWIQNAKISSLGECGPNAASQMTALREPLPVFVAGFGRTINPNEGLTTMNDGTSNGTKLVALENANTHATASREEANDMQLTNGSIKRTHENGPGENSDRAIASRTARRVRFASDSDDDDN